MFLRLSIILDFLSLSSSSASPSFFSSGFSLSSLPSSFFSSSFSIPSSPSSPSFFFFKKAGLWILGSFGICIFSIASLTFVLAFLGASSPSSPVLSPSPSSPPPSALPSSALATSSSSSSPSLAASLFCNKKTKF